MQVPEFWHGIELHELNDNKVVVVGFMVVVA
jgi:hypothetical protein